MAENCDTWYGF